MGGPVHCFASRPKNSCLKRHVNVIHIIKLIHLASPNSLSLRKIKNIPFPSESVLHSYLYFGSPPFSPSSLFSSSPYLSYTLTRPHHNNKSRKVKATMAANKFATMLHRNTNKIIVILVYAVLEWVLIGLLLLNSLFSYVITKFAKWVGLQPPCPWCSRVDRILEPGKSTNLNRELVCETHAAEISKLGFCSNHQRLVEKESMCNNCLASRPNHHDNSIEMRHKIGFISWVSHEKVGSYENINRCTCCNESLSSKLYPPYLLLKPSWGDGNYTSKGTLIVEAIDDEKDEGDKELEFERNNGEDHEHDDEGVAGEHQILSDIESFILREVAEDRSSSVSNLHSDEKDADRDEKEDYLTITGLDPSDADNLIGQFWEDRSLEVINMHFENYVACDIPRLMPVELIDYVTCVNFESCKSDEDLGEKEQKIEAFATESPIRAQSSIFEGSALFTMDKNSEKKRELESLENSIGLEVEDLKQDSVVELLPERITTDEAQTSSNDGNNIEASAEEPDNTKAYLPQSQEPACSYKCTQEDEYSTSDDDAEVQNAFDEFITLNNLCKSQPLSIGGNNVEAAIEELDNTRANQPPSQEPSCSCECTQEDQSSTSDDDTEVPNAFDEFIAQNNLCPDKTGADDNRNVELIEKTCLVKKNHEETSHQSSKCSESCEVEEDKLPETPTSVDGLHYLHRKMMLFGKRELGAEESVDGSVASEVECGDPVLTIERLKTSLKAEQKTLSVLYQELEEERSASAIAANQTMAMITRLQEEKAAMQMEALQYQRMMEEQSEYDQEALQLLNELMMKREKEKQELEKELEEYRQKVMDYEAKEKLRVLRRMKDGSARSRDSSSSCSNIGDIDELSIDLNCEAKDEGNGFFNHHEGNHNNTTVDAVSNLEEMAIDCVKHTSALDNSLAEFEEERLSILDELKALEEKLITLGDNKQFLDNINLIEHSSTPGDKDLKKNCNVISPKDNMYSNGFSDDKHSPIRTMGSLAKSLLPYLDAADNETEEAHTLVDMQNSVPTLEMDSMKVSFEEEVDHVYERLQAFETDREFLKHCMGSIEQGDTGMDLLQEILQQLRDLKAVELRLKNLGNNPLG